MGGSEAELSRRRWLQAAASATGLFGLCAAAVPLIRSLEPDAGAQANAVATADISQMAPGEIITVSWVERPVFVLRRTPEMIASLSAVTPELLDPSSSAPQQPTYCRNPHRSRDPEWLVVFGVCTHLCCSPLYSAAAEAVMPGWRGGFHCPCHGSFYDLAGRVYRNMPAPFNLAVPEYEFEEGGKQIRILGRPQGAVLC